MSIDIGPNITEEIGAIVVCVIIVVPVLAVLWFEHQKDKRGAR